MNLLKPILAAALLVSGCGERPEDISEDRIATVVSILEGARKNVINTPFVSGKLHGGQITLTTPIGTVNGPEGAFFVRERCVVDIRDGNARCEAKTSPIPKSRYERPTNIVGEYSLTSPSRARGMVDTLLLESAPDR